MQSLSIRSGLAALIGAAGLFMLASGQASAGFIAYQIRNSPTINTDVAPYATPNTEFVIAGGGQKGALGSNDVNGATIGSLTSIKVDRLDNPNRFTPGSGPAVAPYLNIWITDGAGHYAVLANEPSNPAFQPLYNNGYDLSYADLADKSVKVYEFDREDTGWLPGGGTDHVSYIEYASFSVFENFTIAPPPPGYIADASKDVGSGAPRQDGTNVAYGVNWVFGDTLSNYVSGDEGYVVANAGVRASVTDVPEPASLALFGAGLGGLVLLRRRRVAAAAA